MNKVNSLFLTKTRFELCSICYFMKSTLYYIKDQNLLLTMQNLKIFLLFQFSHNISIFSKIFKNIMPILENTISNLYCKYILKQWPKFVGVDRTCFNLLTIAWFWTIDSQEVNRDLLNQMYVSVAKIKPVQSYSFIINKLSYWMTFKSDDD